MHPRTGLFIYMTQVPRVWEVTSAFSKEDRANVREWHKAQANFQNDIARYGFGTKQGKAAWKERVSKLRTK